MSLRSYGFGKVVKKSKITVKGKKAFLKLLLSLNQQGDEQQIEALLFCDSKPKERLKLSSIGINSLVFLDGELCLNPIKIISSSFKLISTDDSAKNEKNYVGIIDGKVLKLSLSKARLSLLSKENVQTNDTPKMHCDKVETDTNKHNDKRENASRDVYSPNEFKNVLG